jgi:hypothetical protein
MKAVSKLAMLLAVLAICIPVYGQGEVDILIYAKTIKCWEAWEVEDDGVDWEIEEEHITAFLVLEALYDDLTGEILEILDAVQIEYWKDGRDKIYGSFGEEYIIERVDVGDDVIWVLEQLYGDTEPEWGEILMIRGKAKDTNIGLGRDEKREVAKRLNGYILYLYLDEGVEKSMCTMSIRLLQRWTRLANDPDEGDSDFDYAIDEIVGAWLTKRGYEELK